jgi:hypothetical protein
MKTNCMTTPEAIDYLVETGGDCLSGDGKSLASWEDDSILVHAVDTDLDATTYSLADFDRREKGRFWKALPLEHFDGRDGVLPESEIERRAGE